MKTTLFILIAFFLGFSAVAGYQYVHSLSAARISIAPVAGQPTPEPTLALVPPSEAVSGILTAVSGHAEKFSRGDTAYKEASTGAKILLGESIATKENSSATASVSSIVNVNMGPKAELVFTNVFPSNFILQQKSGKIEYLAIQPMSVRALHTLISLNPGGVTINIIDTDMSITVKTGSVKFALVDTDNNTGVWNLRAGQRANIDDKARKVYLVQAR